MAMGSSEVSRRLERYLDPRDLIHRRDTLMIAQLFTYPKPAGIASSDLLGLPSTASPSRPSPSSSSSPSPFFPSTPPSAPVGGLSVHSNESKNISLVRQVVGSIRDFHPGFRIFTDQLTDGFLRKFNSSMELYLRATKGRPPRDLISIQKKLLQTSKSKKTSNPVPTHSAPNGNASSPTVHLDSHPEPMTDMASSSHSPTAAATGAAVDSVPFRSAASISSSFSPSAVYNTVGEVVIDLACVVLNAMAFNPPTHPVHTTAVDLGNALLSVHFPAIRKGLKLSFDQELCYKCGVPDHTEGDLMLNCASCGLWFHQQCEFVSAVPVGDFTCLECEAVQASRKVQKAVKRAEFAKSSIFDLVTDPISKERKPRGHDEGSASTPLAVVEADEPPLSALAQLPPSPAAPPRKRLRPSPSSLSLSSRSSQLLLSSSSLVPKHSAEQSALASLLTSFQKSWDALTTVKEKMSEYTLDRRRRMEEEMDELVMLEEREKEVEMFRDLMKDVTDAEVEKLKSARAASSSSSVVSHLDTLAASRQEVAVLKSSHAAELKSLHQRAQSHEAELKALQQKLSLAERELFDERRRGNFLAEELNRRSDLEEAMKGQLEKFMKGHKVLPLQSTTEPDTKDEEADKDTGLEKPRNAEKDKAKDAYREKEKYKDTPAAIADIASASSSSAPPPSSSSPPPPPSASIKSPPPVLAPVPPVPALSPISLDGLDLSPSCIFSTLIGLAESLKGAALAQEAKVREKRDRERERGEQERERAKESGAAAVLREHQMKKQKKASAPSASSTVTLAGALARLSPPVVAPGPTQSPRAQTRSTVESHSSSSALAPVAPTAVVASPTYSVSVSAAAASPAAAAMAVPTAMAATSVLSPMPAIFRAASPSVVASPSGTVAPTPAAAVLTAVSVVTSATTIAKPLPVTAATLPRVLPATITAAAAAPKAVPMPMPVAATAVATATVTAPQDHPRPKTPPSPYLAFLQERAKSDKEKKEHRKNSRLTSLSSSSSPAPPSLGVNGSFHPFSHALLPVPAQVPHVATPAATVVAKPL